MIGARLQAGEAVFALVQTIPSPTISELAAWSGYDAIILDCEHGTRDEAAHLACIQALSGTGAAVGVRLPPRDWAGVGRYLDLGVDMVLMADVTSADMAAQFVTSSHSGAGGIRSASGATRARRYGLSGRSERPPLLLALIEGAAAADAAAEIAAVHGLDGLLVGPSDLSADLGRPGDFGNDVYRGVMAHVAEAAKAHGLILGTRPHAGFELPVLLAAGHRFIVTGADIGILRSGMSCELNAAREAAPGIAP
jgi:2-keto-3-deoxy-L-rhamnonate aldolase RhmA